MYQDCRGGQGPKDKPEVPSKGKYLKYGCSSDDPMVLSDDSDTSDDGGLLAHFYQYYGGENNEVGASMHSPLPT